MKIEEKYPFNYQTRVKWGELDALRHLNNTVYFRYCEEARIQMISEMDQTTLLAKGQGPVLAFIDCKFVAPVFHPDLVTVCTWVDQIGNSSMQLMHHIYSNKQSKLVAISKAVLVYVDYSTGRKVRISDAFRSFIEDRQGGYDLIELEQ